jgi:membrane protein involved in colicin uptake
MALKIDTNQSATAYHVTTGAFLFPYAVDAQHAISAHPLEWSETPWARADADASRKRLNEQNKADGLPPIAEPAPLSPEDQKALDEHNKAVAEAAKRLDEYYKKKTEEEKIAAQVAADEALVSSVPPQPDPTIRRPLTPAQIRKASATLTPEEEKAKSEADRAEAKAANDKIAHDKAEADRIGLASRHTI